jgi:hypothetical protein
MVLNLHAPNKDKTDDIKDIFYEEIKFVIKYFSKYCMYIFLADFNAQVDREDIFTLTIWYDRLREICNGNE